jgi:hypothetical protein
LGFVIGSLGVVWPWKKTTFLQDENGLISLDSNGNEIITSYQRFLPKLTAENLLAIGFIILGIGIIFAIEWYGKKRRNT